MTKYSNFHIFISSSTLADSMNPNQGDGLSEPVVSKDSNSNEEDIEEFQRIQDPEDLPGYV